jgi:hypothetical protein
MQPRTRRLTIFVSLAALILIALAQYVSWRESGRFNPGLIAAVALILPGLWAAWRSRYNPGP